MLIPIKIPAQETDDSCGLACLSGVYEFLNHPVPLKRLLNEVSMLKDGGTLSVSLGIHALQNGLSVEIFQYNLQIFDPTWQNLNKTALIDKLHQQIKRKHYMPKLVHACNSYIRYLELGGIIRFDELTSGLLEKIIDEGKPITVGLNSTYMYQASREDPVTTVDDDLGFPAGHFVVVSGYSLEDGEFVVHDPYRENPIAPGSECYPVSYHHLIASIFLGIVTYDANLLVISH